MAKAAVLKAAGVVRAAAVKVVVVAAKAGVAATVADHGTTVKWVEAGGEWNARERNRSHQQMRITSSLDVEVGDFAVYIRPSAGTSPQIQTLWVRCPF